MKQVTFYYCRHGETMFQAAGRMEGWCDSPLTDRGREQMRSAARHLRSVPFNSAYLSSDERCRDSFDLIKDERKIPWAATKSLKEVFFGSLEGAEISAHAGEIHEIRTGSRDWSPYGGESREDIENRIRNTFQRIYENSSDMDRILLVSGGELFVDLLTVLFKIPYERLLKAARLDEEGEVVIANGVAGTFICREGIWEILNLKGYDTSILKQLRSIPDGLILNGMIRRDSDS